MTAPEDMYDRCPHGCGCRAEVARKLERAREALRWLCDEIGDPAKPKHPSVDAIQAARAELDAEAGRSS